MSSDIWFKTSKDEYEVRAQLEGPSIRQAFKEMIDVEIENLQSIYQQMLEAASIEDLREKISLYVEFHETIVKGSKSRILEIAWRSSSARTAPPSTKLSRVTR